MRSEWFQVMTGNLALPRGEQDALAFDLPAGLMVVHNGRLIPRVPVFARFIAQLTAEAPRIHGCLVYSAEWIATDESELIEEILMCQPDCVRCRSNVDQALAALSERRRPLLLCRLFWVATPSGDRA